MRFRILIDGNQYGPWHDVAEYYGFNDEHTDKGEVYDQVLSDWQQRIDVEVAD